MSETCGQSWSLSPEGWERLRVSYDTSAQYFPDNIEIREYGPGGDNLYIPIADVPWLIERLQEAMAAIGPSLAASLSARSTAE